MPVFSVVIAARDAASTIATTIATLQEQTCGDWEAIVVDDGSRDETALVVHRCATKDPRVRLISTPGAQGVSAARNLGVRAAEGVWLLFLDADDTLFPPALEAWQRCIASDRTLDVVCGRWVRVAPDGRVVIREQWPVTDDMFPTFARLSAYPIHSCVVRRQTVLDAGGFDPSYVTCEDWDLWQRVARAGAKFGGMDVEVARYHMRPGSASLAARQMLIDGLRVITTGHSSDPRVAAPNPRYASGLDEDVSEVRFGYACWPAGLVLGSGEDAVPLLDEVNDRGAPRLNPALAADALFRSSTLPLCSGPEVWSELWPAISPRLTRFLDGLEERTHAPFLSRRVIAVLARTILQHAGVNVERASAGRAMLHTVDVVEPAKPAVAPLGVERAVVRVQVERDLLGWLELPVCDGSVTTDVLCDAIASAHGWTILGRFFDATVYRDVKRRSGRTGVEAVRRRVVLGAATENDADWMRRRHDLIGWTVFLQELWGRPDLPPGAFYDPDTPGRGTRKRVALDGWISVDVLDDPRDWRVDGDSVDVELTIADAPVCCTRVGVDHGVVRAARLRALLTTAAGVELVHVAVREALIGTPWTKKKRTLRELLSRRRRPAPDAAAGDRFPGLSPAAARRLAGMRGTEDRCAMVAARQHGSPGSPASRRADLPASVWREVLEAAETAAEPVISVAGPRDPERLAYVPELLWRGAQQSLIAAAATVPSPSSAFGRHHFEALFAGAADPWRYTTSYETRKYEQTLSMVPSSAVGVALEIGCAEGHFTELLAERVGTLKAVDISAIALDRAAERCKRHRHVSFAPVDLASDPLPGGNDLIVCSEVLYYVGPVDTLREVGLKLRDALREGAQLITTHARVAADEADGGGFAWPVPFGVRTIKEVLAATPGLQLARELRTALYSVLVFVRSDEPHTVTVVDGDFVMPEPAVASKISWGASDVAVAPPPKRAETLPILAYHRIAHGGAEATRRYCVSPEDFERQLRYLREAGFRSVSLGEWVEVIQRRQPLAGRGVALTFDDGYEDFREHAMPLLARYGFTATLFVVTGHVGGHNAWETAGTERVALMDWPALQRAAAAGIELGAHSVTHPPLTTLSPAEIVREASRARADIQGHIGRPVTAFSYPYGDSDAVVEHLVGGSGFLAGVTSRAGVSRLHDRALRLPRNEITGRDSLVDFIRKLG